MYWNTTKSVTVVLTPKEAWMIYRCLSECGAVDTPNIKHSPVRLSLLDEFDQITDSVRALNEDE